MIVWSTSSLVDKLAETVNFDELWEVPLEEDGLSNDFWIEGYEIWFEYVVSFVVPLLFEDIVLYIEEVHEFGEETGENELCSEFVLVILPLEFCANGLVGDSIVV